MLQFTFLSKLNNLSSIFKMNYFGIFAVVCLQFLWSEAGNFIDNRGSGGKSSVGGFADGGQRSWGAIINKDKGGSPQDRTEGSGIIHTRKNGKWRTDAYGHHEMGRGWKPDVSGVFITSRWRQEAEENQQHLAREKRSFAPGGNFPSHDDSKGQQRGSWSVDVNKNKGRGPQIRTEGQGNIYSSPNGKVRVDGHGYHEFGKGRKPDYGVGVKVQGRWRREATNEDAVEELHP